MKHIHSSHQLAKALLDLPDSDLYVADKYSVQGEPDEDDLYREDVGYAEIVGIEVRMHCSFWDDSSYEQIVLIPETRDLY